MASAGAMRTVTAIACSVPATAVSTVSASAVSISQGATTCVNAGNRKKSAYRPSIMRPITCPRPTPSTKPASTMASTIFR